MSEAQILDSPILASTLFLTFLMLIGFFFFIRASVKDRTEKITLIPEKSPELLLKQLQTYFEKRAYHVQTVEPQAENQLILAGFVESSWFLTFFLTILAGLGLFCLALVLSFVNPDRSNLYFYLILLAPIAGIFYRIQAARVEKIGLKIEAENLVTVVAHRDELILLQEKLPVKVWQEN